MTAPIIWQGLVNFSSFPRFLASDMSKCNQHDINRHKAFAEYVIEVILRIPKTLKGRSDKDRNERSTYDPYTYAFFGDYIFGKLVKDNRRAATTAGQNFLHGRKTITIGDFVDIIGTVYKNLDDNYKVKVEKNIVLPRERIPVPTPQQILEALQILTRLSAEELREKLKADEKLQSLFFLMHHAQHALLQRAFINLATIKSETLPDIYREVYQLSLHHDQPPTQEVPFDNSESIEGYIIKELGENKTNIPNGSPSRNKTISALKKILLQAGTGQARFIESLDDQENYIQNYLSKAFVNQLLPTIDTNNQLRERLPIYLKSIAIDPVGPFPLPKPHDPEIRNSRNSKDKEIPQSSSLLSQKLLNKKYPSDSVSDKWNKPIDDWVVDLPTRPVMHVTGHFYIRLSELSLGEEKKYKGFDYKTHLKMRQETGQDIQVQFKVSSIGIGGSYSLITKVVNQALLSDIKYLKQRYFPIARDLFIKQTNINQRVLSPVSSHNYVQLCRTETVTKAMQDCSGNEIACYEDFSDYDSFGVGEFSDFDVLTSAANASLMARLQAILNTDIDREDYIVSILTREEQQYLLNEAQSFLNDYPFSSFALTSWIQAKILENKNNKLEALSYTVCNAQLTIVETLLTEGAYRIAHRHLKKLGEKLKQHSDQGIKWLLAYSGRSENHKSEDFDVFSGKILARYEICLARYLMVLDAEDQQEEKKYFLDLFDEGDNPIQAKLVAKAWKHLTRAEQHLTVRLVKYHIVDEVSQATFHPYYQLLGQIYFRRGRLLLWYPTLVAPDYAKWRPPTQAFETKRDNPHHARDGRLYLFERARVFAACDGDIELYIICTAYQCRTWLRASFDSPGDRSSTSYRGNNDLSFTNEECLAWAKRLRNDALLQYAPIGKRCYHAIKEKSGLEPELLAKQKELSDQSDDKCIVKPIPPIRETFNGHEPGYETKDDEAKDDETILFLDMQYLAIKRFKVDPDNSNSLENIYLFGPQSCHLFLIRGLYHLCTDHEEEFPDIKSQHPDKIQSMKAWDHKIKQCYHLFNYAWSIAGDGCGIEPDSENDAKQTITRQIGKENQGIDNGIDDPHARSVWNLYPHRITEIVDIAKVFAAACAALRCHTATSSKVIAERKSEMETLLDSLPGGNSYSYASDLALQEANNWQPRFNGHLVKYLKACSTIIKKEIEGEALKTDGAIRATSVERRRNKLLKQLFDLHVA
ncbi:hypothetical protein D0962_20565 [Leptolyngbyaceae cyanobacterium CCMR0082]|uniref:Uncharacterized protein n=1 Tax=Adonisia turfae CCMR0082 TaxID=2304604 RepID=A0A6M0S9G8_9CYAN|nr:hypothetical protein [Adonisia turfae]NEZ65138.1 hypothetical protein [Adonisia turfae CCMR0082]